MIFDPPRNPGEVREQSQAVWLFSAKPAANKHLILKLGDSQSVHGTAAAPFTHINKKHRRASKGLHVNHDAQNQKMLWLWSLRWGSAMPCWQQRFHHLWHQGLSRTSEESAKRRWLMRNEASWFHDRGSVTTCYVSKSLTLWWALNIFDYSSTLRLFHCSNVGCSRGSDKGIFGTAHRAWALRGARLNSMATSWCNEQVLDVYQCIRTQCNAEQERDAGLDYMTLRGIFKNGQEYIRICQDQAHFTPCLVPIGFGIQVIQIFIAAPGLKLSVAHSGDLSMPVPCPSLSFHVLPCPSLSLLLKFEDPNSWWWRSP